ncbi:MAG TPA: AgmX/PglI C-terminal domain-containing protein [Kofleriaceae bacterium]
MSTVALRTALIWQDEVMDDVVLQKPTKITVGSAGKTTFTVPSVGLPKGFAIVRPGNRGYLLTLGERMRGTICLDGQQKDVQEFVQASAERGGFAATPISGKDWGVISLDESGDYKLFFQFVPIEDASAQPFFTKQVITAGILGYLISIAALALFFYWRGVSVDFTLFDSEQLGELAEAGFRGFCIASAALSISAIGWWLVQQEGDQQASFAFSVLLHAALLFMTYQLYDGSNPFVWPGPRSLTGSYLVTRLEPEEPQEPKPTVATIGQQKDQGATAPKTLEKPKNTATKNDEGAAGGKGDTERARDPNAKDVPPAPPKVALFEDKNRKVLDNIIDRNLSTSLDKFTGIKGDEVKRGSLGFGEGTGTGVGTGVGTGTTRGSNKNGSGGGGNAEGDFVSKKGAIDTGKERPGGGTCAKPPCGTSPKEVKVTLQDAEGDFGGLTAEEINRVVKARQGIFRACYQAELNRNPGIGGKLVVSFQIGGDGIVKSAKIGGASSMRNDGVEGCVKSNIMRLKFPAKGGLANVNYPFLFQPGG